MSPTTPIAHRLMTSFTLAAATLLSAGCATTPQQGCNYTTATENKINGMTPTERKATDGILGAIPLLGTLTFTVHRLNQKQCAQTRVGPALAATK